MKRIDKDTIQLPQCEIDRICDFIRSHLADEWNRYTEHYICPNISFEDGVRRMDPEMYDMVTKLQSL